MTALPVVEKFVNAPVFGVTSPIGPGSLRLLRKSPVEKPKPSFDVNVTTPVLASYEPPVKPSPFGPRPADTARDESVVPSVMLTVYTAMP